MILHVNQEKLQKCAIIVPVALLWTVSAISLVSGIASAVIADIYLSERISIIGSHVGLQYSLNSGIAFGIKFYPPLQAFLILVALIAVAVIGFRSTKALAPNYQPLTPIGFGLILGGGIANIIDRLRDGFVTDYFQIGLWPIFNVADSFVTVGVMLLLFEIVIFRRDKE